MWIELITQPTAQFKIKNSVEGFTFNQHQNIYTRHKINYGNQLFQTHDKYIALLINLLKSKTVTQMRGE